MGYRRSIVPALVWLSLFAIAVAATMHFAVTVRWYSLAAICFVLTVVAAMRLMAQIRRAETDVNRLITALRYDDYSQAFTLQVDEKETNPLASAFEEVISKFRQVRVSQEKQYQYLRTIVRHIGVGLIVFKSTGEIDILNPAAKRILGVGHVRSVRELDKHGIIHQRLQDLGSGKTALVDLECGRGSVQMLLSKETFRMSGAEFTLAVVQDITRELAYHEMLAWQRLARVLAHEIANSVTPITSLAATAHEMLTKAANSASTREGDDQRAVLTDTALAVDAIRRRGNGLVRFVSSFRTLTHLPPPRFRLVSVRQLLERVKQLATSDKAAEKIDIAVEVVPGGLEATMDPELIEQALLNLIANATAALKDTPEAFIRLSGLLRKEGGVIIEVSDNGPGIEESALERIFVPFFSTRPGGTGIGLSLARETVRLHGGLLTVHSQPNQLTVFRICLYS